jgi:hypothetical protein
MNWVGGVVVVEGYVLPLPGFGPTETFALIAGDFVLLVYCHIQYV